ncbi:hypothetical protein SCP_1701740 [Sparassis crispa]|uniref:Uncharacterized protein n=1 Tax=Sparassis crispa TaxID=139825 RepID=A0A401H635_9APHY|nr:hypothetical protein SCP_1701740 [Sparassis crispa]GBE89849.1 hypothetical protein SCP_1701740 [Sparassis crispa]
MSGDECECEPSTSVATIRGLNPLNISLPIADSPSSPHSVLPSPSSPSGDSISSFPSVSSSFMFSSGPASPPRAPADSDPEDSQGLIIPSLTLPSAGRHPTPYGQTLGDLRLLFLAPRFAGITARALTSALLDDNDDVVEIDGWEQGVDAAADGVLRASTHWLEQHDAHGLEHFEPARNVELVELTPYDLGDDAETIVARVLAKVHAPFQQVHGALNPDSAPSAVLAGLLASPCTPLYTALVLLLTTTPSTTEKALLVALSPHIPLIVFPPLISQPSRPSYPSSAYPYFQAYLDPPPATLPGTVTLSAFRPSSTSALRAGLFRTPETLSVVRAEAAARFLRWREVERAVDAVPPSPSVREPPSHGSLRWDKAEWEAQWEHTLSQDVAVRRRSRAGTARNHDHASVQGAHAPARPGPQSADDRCMNALDPLHIPSLVVFSLSLLSPLRTRVVGAVKSGLGWRSAPTEEASVSNGTERMSFGFGSGLGLALVGAFCAGIGIGLLVARG